MTGAIRMAVVGDKDEAASVRLLRAWIEDPDAAGDALVFHRKGSLHREPDGTAFFVDGSGWHRPAEVPLARPSLQASVAFLAVLALALVVRAAVVPLCWRS